MISELAVQPGLAGFAFGLTLTVSIGPQTLCLIRSGITGSHPVAVATTAYVSEVLLVAAGVAGVSSLIAAVPGAREVLFALGFCFLMCCGCRTLMTSSQAHVDAKVALRNDQPAGAIYGILAMTWCNPLTYAEAMFMVGTLSSAYAADARIAFAAGYLASSAVRFYGWSYLGARLSAQLGRRDMRRLFDLASVAVIFALAGMLGVGLAMNLFAVPVS